MNKPDSILRAINGNSKKGLNILTAPTHERSQAHLRNMPHTFYLLNHHSFKKWNYDFSPLPSNYVMLGDALPPNVCFDLIISQNKFGQFQHLKQISDAFSIPLISIEHTLPVRHWPQHRMEAVRKLKGDIDVFITEFQKNQWGWEGQTEMIPCAVDLDEFYPHPNIKKNLKVLTVVNDYKNRDYFCGWSLYQRLTQGLDTHALGDTPGFSLPAKSVDDLREAYQRASVFLNTSQWSTMPVTLLEAMACGCPIVTTDTCDIGRFIKDGENGFISNDESYLRDRLEWCINNPEEASKLGEAARETVAQFNVHTHVEKWQNVFDKAYGTIHKV